MNPVIPDTRYNCKLGLGTPLEYRLNPSFESANQKPRMTPEELKKEAEERLNALPSYLRKEEKGWGWDGTKNGTKSSNGTSSSNETKEIIPFEEMVQIKTKYKMNQIDLNLEKLKDRDYARLLKV